MRIDIGIGCWRVYAPWLGQERVVFVGTIWECIDFRRNMESARLREDRLATV